MSRQLPLLPALILTTLVPGGLHGQSPPTPTVTPTVGLSLGYSSLTRSTHTLTETYPGGGGTVILLNDRAALGGRTIALSGGVRFGRNFGVLVQATDWREQGLSEHLMSLLFGLSIRSTGRHAAVLHLIGGPVKVPVQDDSESWRADVHYSGSGQLARRASATGALVQLAAGYERRLRDKVVAEFLVHWAHAGAKDSTGFHMRYRDFGARMGLVFLLKTPTVVRATARWSSEFSRFESSSAP